MRPVRVRVTINGRRCEADVEPRTLLSDFIRHEAGLTGTHVGCEQGVCGACSVLRRPARAPAFPFPAVHRAGAPAETVAGLAAAPTPHPLQSAFEQTHALQCGFCTPGMLMTLDALLRRRPDAGVDEVRAALGGNLCRCTGYAGVVAAVRLAQDGR